MKVFSKKSDCDIVTDAPLVFLFDVLAYFFHAVIFIVTQICECEMKTMRIIFTKLIAVHNSGLDVN